MSGEPTVNAYDVLEQRGLIAQCTESPGAARRRLSEPVVVYNGFDPTADSLHVGHLIPILGLAHLQRAGHRPIAVVGGATALVGDPSGKTSSRPMLTPDDVSRNAEAIRGQLSRFLDFGDGPGDALLLNNAEWLTGLSWIDVLREVGAKLSVNRMLSMDSVKGRMTPESGEGISFLEFNYMVMQAYDFLHLYRTRGCTMQTGGQDQWGNIVMGLELIRRSAGDDLTSRDREGAGRPEAGADTGPRSLTVAARADAEARSPAVAARQGEQAAAAGLTFPLVTKADGGKFGKTESGTVWLDAGRTPPYELYQFFRNTADADVGRYLAQFTFLPMDRVRELTAEGGKALNEAKAVLAHEMTRLIHGDAEADAARDAATRAFGAGDVTAESIPHADLPADELAGEGVGLLTLLVRAGLAKSNGEARRLISGGGVRLHDAKVNDVQRSVTGDDVVDGHVVLRAGKKRVFRYDVV
jgi:tyrosyl-tRNA synthetase